ncbi:Glycosyltransferase, GT2 family [Limnospira platensis C1]|nr:Glycosyltransferase, GT2 family [Arthrospira platensis C1]
MSPGVDSALAVAAVLEKLGRWTEAVDQYRQVVLEFGECGPASLGLGRALAELERPVEAVVEWRRAVKLGVEAPEVHRLLAETLVELGRWSEVVEHWKWLLERYPGAVDWRRRLALALMGLGRWTEAAAQWGEYWRVAPGSGRGRVVDFRPQKKTHGEIDHSQELSITGDLTVEFWLYLRRWPKSWTEIISKFVSDEQNEFCFRLKDDQKGQWYYGKGDGCSTSINWVPKKDIRLHEWVHVACVRKVGQYGRIYFNGVLGREDDWSRESEAVGTEAPVRLMGSPQWQRFHDGKLSEVRLWNRARSGDEIREGMCEGLTGEEPGLVGLWHGDESDEGVLVDAVGHHHGRLVMAADAGKERPRVGVCGWELSHNAAGRAYTLAQLYGGFAEVELIGCLFPKYGGQVWEPIRETEIPCHTIRVEDEGRFVEQALALVLAHPYEVVHLSKPRMPNIVLGLLYKLVWDARVIVDIDDEELAFVKASETLDLRELLESGGKLPPFQGWDGGKWTRLAVGLARAFDGVTVANPALQERYGGVVIRHGRDEARFVPSDDRKRRSRERFGIAQDKKVVLFFGTPKEYKGLVATARALGSLGRKDVVFAIIGDFPDGKLKEELQGIPGVDYVFVGNQPFESIPDVVAVGDICVLLQDVGSEVSQFQIPAKLSDALGMGLVVLLSETAAVADVIESGAVVPVAEGDLPAVLDRVLSDEAECNKFRVRGRELLAAEFGFGVNGSRLAAVMDEVRSGVGVLSDELNLLLAGFPAVGSVWQHWGEGVLETRRLRPVGQGVSIIVLSWNGAGLLRRLLSSFFATNTYFPVEFIIIDHGSEDNTAEVVRQQAIKGDVRYINRGANFSFSDSCNYGAGLAKYPYLLFLNNDIVFSSDVLPLAVSRLDDATIGAVGVRLDDEPSSLPKGKEPGVQHTGIEFVWNEKRGYFQPEQIRHGSLKDYLANATAEGDFFPAVTGAFLLCRKGDWERVGGFSLDYDYGLEDIDFCLRLGRDLQKKCYCINEVSLQHQEGATRQKGNQQQRREVRENNHRLFKQGWDNYVRDLIGEPNVILDNINHFVFEQPALNRKSSLHSTARINNQVLTQPVVILNTNYSTRNSHITLAILEAARDVCKTSDIVFAQYSDVIEICSGLSRPILICLDGQRLNSTILSRAKKHTSCMVLWTFDDPYNLQSHTKFLDLFDYFFTNDASSALFYKDKGEYLPLAAPHTFLNSSSCMKKYDIFFCGTAWPNRVVLLNKLIRDRPNLKYKIALTYNKHLPLIPLSLPNSSYVYPLAFNDFLRCAERSKITISLHRVFSGNDKLTTSSSPGPRMFEVAAARAFQISEKGGSDFENIFGNDVVSYFDNYGELLKKIDYYLVHEEQREEIALKCYKYIMQNHTYLQRISYILDKCKTISEVNSFIISNIQKPRILFVVHNTINSQDFGGLEIHQNVLAKNIADKFDVYYFYSAMSNDNKRYVKFTNCQYKTIKEINISEKNLHSFLEYPHIEKFFSECVDEYEINLIHFFHFMHNIPSLAHIARAMNLPYVVSIHDFYIACRSFTLMNYVDEYCQNDITLHSQCDTCLQRKYNFPPGSQIRRREYYGEILKNASAVIYMSQSTQNIMESIFPELALSSMRRIHGAPLPDTLRLQSDASDNSACINPKPIKFLILGNMATHKGGIYLLKALQECQNIEAEFHFYGGIDNNIRKRIITLIAGKAVFHGRYEPGTLDITNYHFSLHLSVWPETYCQTLSQAWAAGIVPIVTDIGALGERVKHNVNGLKVDYRNPSQLAYILKEVVENPEGYLKMKANINDTLFLTQDTHANLFEQVYLQLLAQVNYTRQSYQKISFPNSEGVHMAILTKTERNKRWNELKKNHDNDDLIMPDHNFIKLAGKIQIFSGYINYLSEGNIDYVNGQKVSDLDKPIVLKNGKSININGWVNCQFNGKLHVPVAPNPRKKCIESKIHYSLKFTN